jgi:exodeoxyribonuclease VII large subunit
LVSPNRAELLVRLEDQKHRLMRAMARRLEDRMQRLDYLAKRLLPPAELLRHRRMHIDHLARRLRTAIDRVLGATAHRVERAGRRLLARSPDLTGGTQRIGTLRYRLCAAGHRAVERRYELLGRLSAQLSHLNPAAVLARGYSITRHEDGRIVRAAAEVDAGERLSLTFAAGGARVRVEDADK